MNAAIFRPMLAIFTIVTLICFAAPAFAAKGSETVRVNSLRAGSWSLQFRIADDFQLSSFQGATISTKRHFSEGRALRVGISLNGSVTDMEYRTINVAADSAIFESRTDENQQYVRLDAQYLFYPSPDEKLTVFIGTGPLFELSRSEVSGQGQWRLHKIWRFGMSAVMGVEWFATKKISFLTEYSSAVTYDIQKSESTYNYNKYKNEDERQSLSFSYNSVKFGLSAYF
jgi:hypothetical protein